MIIFFYLWLIQSIFRNSIVRMRLMRDFFCVENAHVKAWKNNVLKFLGARCQRRELRSDWYGNERKIFGLINYFITWFWLFYWFNFISRIYFSSWIFHFHARVARFHQVTVAVKSLENLQLNYLVEQIYLKAIEPTSIVTSKSIHLLIRTKKRENHFFLKVWNDSISS